MAKLAGIIEHRGGRMVFIQPPLLNGLQAGLLADPQTGPALERTKREIAAWAAAGLSLSDVADAEPKGCRPDWFVDGHGATGECFTLIVPRLAALLSASGGQACHDDAAPADR